ncbi:Maf family protein [Vreelandella arcis]|uniref:dTTP/UTP pyrophosphatase n=1 Tax=Vreelandella arcis TaxID=416873 RepID=A0A1G9ZJ09_9GAMM|nr:Maf family protein [Halomonas arcis]SDN20493.1 septum formation protein [Halomonas arcis]
MSSQLAPVLCLASASPRRRALLESIGVAVQVHPCDIDETPLANEPAEDYVRRLAQAKAHAARSMTPLPTLGSDTALVIDGQILGKPDDEAHAAGMLRLLSGRRHTVLTGVAVTGPQGMLVCSVATQVMLRDISDSEIAAYWRTGEPCDKAGSYAIQGMASVFVERIEGSHSAVVGLPLFETACLLRRQGVPLWNGHLPA